METRTKRRRGCSPLRNPTLGARLACPHLRPHAKRAHDDDTHYNWATVSRLTWRTYDLLTVFVFIAIIATKLSLLAALTAYVLSSLFNVDITFLNMWLLVKHWVEPCIPSDGLCRGSYSCTCSRYCFSRSHTCSGRSGLGGFRAGREETGQEGEWGDKEGDCGCGLWVNLLRFITPSHVGL